MIRVMQWVMEWLGFARQDGIFYIGGSDILPPPLKQSTHIPERIWVPLGAQRRPFSAFGRPLPTP